MRKVPLRALAVSLLSFGALGGSLAVGGNGGVAATSGPIRLVIGYRAGVPGTVPSGLDRAYGLHQVGAIADLRAQVVTVGSATVATLLFELRHQPTVAYAQVDSWLAPQATAVTPNDPYFTGGMNGQEWGETRDQANQAWSVTTGSSTVTIAVVDSGVDPTQPDLQGVLVPGWNVLTNSPSTADTYGHGTEVAGIAVAATNNAKGIAGYCWTCRLMPVKVYNTSAGAYGSNLASGITWAVDHGANVINVSLGGTSDTTAINGAVSYALAHGVAVVAAAGNSGNTGDPKQYPAAIPGVISVGGSNQSDTLYSYSEWGPWVDVAAPGSQATTFYNGTYASVGGTSMAAPAVAGIIGLMLSVNPSATLAQLKNALYTTTDPVAGTRRVAYGRVNAYRAVTAIQSAPPPTTTSGSPPATAPPANTSVPSISGTDQQGSTLTTTAGTWSGTPTAYAYQWLRCSSTGCSALSGATSSSYLLGSGDVGDQMKVTVTASNAGGSSAATSGATATIAPTSTSSTTTKKHRK